MLIAQRVHRFDKHFQYNSKVIAELFVSRRVNILGGAIRLRVIRVMHTHPS